MNIFKIKICEYANSNCYFVNLRNKYIADLLSGLLESPKMSLDESVLLSKLTDTMRAQLGVMDNAL